MAVESYITELLHPPAESGGQDTVTDLTPLERRLLDEFQHDFPLSPTPFAEMARRLDSTEEQVLYLLDSLQDRGFISRVGPVFKPRRVGTSTLAAMSVPNNHLEGIAAYINAYDEVNHNYERDHHFNLWFVITTPNQKRLEQVLAEIEDYSGLPVMSLPLVRSFHIDLGFPLWC